MRESELHQHIYARSADLAAAFPGVIVGPGDDCAVVRTAGGEELLLKVDQLVEGRHFVTRTPVDLIARKVIARAISDIAAMAGTPRWGLAAGVLPQEYPYANELCDRLAHWARHWGAPLVGGDIAAAPKSPPGAPLCLSITIVGSPHSKRGPVLRSTARAGDEVWVTGRIGGSLESGGGGRHLTFEPRLHEAKILADALGDDLHAMMDISDGLGRDAGRLAAASSVRLAIDGASVPLHTEVKDVITGAADGEDYELLFCTSPGAKPPSIAAGAARIGRVEQGAGCVIRLVDDREIDATTLGWDH